MLNRILKAFGLGLKADKWWINLNREQKIFIRKLARMAFSVTADETVQVVRRGRMIEVTLMATDGLPENMSRLGGEPESRN